MCLMSKVVAGPGALLEGQALGHHHRVHWPVQCIRLVKHLTAVALAGQSCSAAVRLPTGDAQAWCYGSLT